MPARCIVRIMAPLTDRVFVVTGARRCARRVRSSRALAARRRAPRARRSPRDHVTERAREHHALALGADLPHARWRHRHGQRRRRHATAASTASCTPSAPSPWAASSTATPPPTTACSTPTCARSSTPCAPSRPACSPAATASSAASRRSRAGPAARPAPRSTARPRRRPPRSCARSKSKRAEPSVGVCIVYPMGAIDTPANRKDMPDADPSDLHRSQRDRRVDPARRHARPARTT